MIVVRSTGLKLLRAILTLVSLGVANAEAVGFGTVNPSTGSYSQAIPIEVPAFHGIEPKLAVAYSSQGGNGFVGVGWSLAGISTVEWVGAGVGSDKYLLDGQELIVCQSASVSPSCITGGTHSTKTESYLRIKRDTTANTWTVWAKDGTKTILAPVLAVGAYTVRWGQTSVTDTYGNTVTYGWACTGGDCYPNTVSYNGYNVTFFRETRPDVLSFAE